MAEDKNPNLSLEDVGPLPESATFPNGEKEGMVYDIPVNVSIVLGTVSRQVREILYLNRGDLLVLNRRVAEAIDIYVNNRLVARGEVVVVDDRLGLTITEIIKVDK